MSEGTSIEWTHVDGFIPATWNPTRGCIPISPGCKHCYAKTFAERWRGVPLHPYEQGFDLRLVPEKLVEPLTKVQPRAYFVDSMSDLHQDGVPFDYIVQTYAVMQACPQHLFMVLTKRAEAMRDALVRMQHASVLRPMPVALPIITSAKKPVARRGPLRYPWAPLPNVWLGVSVEDRKFGVPRIDVLREAPAAIRFLSIEPLLEDLGTLDLRGIDWVIVGGESGLGARFMDGAWVRSIRDQCDAAGVAFFFKQWGGVRKKTHGRILDGRTHDEYPVRRAA